MTSHLTLTTSLALMTLAGCGYAVATVGMKLAASDMSAGAMLLMLAGLACAAIAEIYLLRHASLAMIYLGVIAFETIVVLTFAAMMGDRLSLFQFAGAGLVLAGFALVTHAE